VSRKTFNQL